jgi:hypothetical protein
MYRRLDAYTLIKTVVCRHEQNAAFIAGGIGVESMPVCWRQVMITWLDTVADKSTVNYLWLRGLISRTGRKRTYLGLSSCCGSRYIAV